MRIGITGHQNIGSKEVINWVKKSIQIEVMKLNVSLGLTCLAVGADQLYAEILNKNNIPYVSIIPCNSYEETFKKYEDLENYIKLKKDSYRVLNLDFASPSEFAFYEAGKSIVDFSDSIISVWNGKEPKGLGGTGDVVKYAISRGVKVVHINPVTMDIEYL